MPMSADLVRRVELARDLRRRAIAERPFEKPMRLGSAGAHAGRVGGSAGGDPCWRHIMWTAESRAFVGDFGAGQALSDEQYALLVPLIPPARPGGRPRTTDM